MPNTWILLPASLLVLFTLGLGIALALLRRRAVVRGEINPGYFLYNRGGKPPEYLLKTDHHFHNLLETPPLFYFATLTLMVLEQGDMGYLVLAWLYLGARLAHAWIHLGSNDLLPRRNAFLAGSMILILIWARIVTQLIVGL